MTLTDSVFDTVTPGQAAALDVALSKGHTMYFLPPTEPVAEGVFARCLSCDANLRYYHDTGMGEAYMVYCPVKTAAHHTPPASTETPSAPTPAIQARLDTYRGATLNVWRDIFMEYARDKGWATSPDDCDVPTMVALMHSELSELLEEWRAHHETNETYYGGTGKPEGIPSELADLIIRALHFAGIFGIDIEDIMVQKHEYNLTRPYRHGGMRI